MNTAARVRAVGKATQAYLRRRHGVKRIFITEEWSSCVGSLAIALALHILNCATSRHFEEVLGMRALVSDQHDRFDVFFSRKCMGAVARNGVFFCKIVF